LTTQEMAADLKRWFRQQRKWSTWNDVARAAGLSPNTLKNYRLGSKMPGPTNRAKLFALTSLDRFAPIGREQAPKSEPIVRQVEGSPQPREILRKWLRDQKKWKSCVDFAKSIGISYGTLKGFLGGKEPRPETRAKLFRGTGLECFRGDSRGTTSSAFASPEVGVEPSVDSLRTAISKASTLLTELNAALQELNSALGTWKARGLELGAAEGADGHVGAVHSLLYLLNDQLSVFRNGTSQDRQRLRTHLNGPDVGYITTLLRALLDEGKFQSWLAMTTHRIGRQTDD